MEGSKPYWYLPQKHPPIYLIHEIHMGIQIEQMLPLGETIRLRKQSRLHLARVGICEENRSPEMMLRRDIFISVQNLMTTDLLI